MNDESHRDLLKLTETIVSAHLQHNGVPAAEVPNLIREVYSALASAGQPAVEDAAPPEPAVPVKRSVQPDYIVCLEDGKKLKMLRRHLKTAYNMTPEEYRVKWNLPRDYPMVAPNYAAKRSVLAKQIGLGRKPSEKAAPVPVAKAPPKARRSRKSA